MAKYWVANNPNSEITDAKAQKLARASNYVDDKVTKFQIFDDFHAAALDATDKWVIYLGSDGDATSAVVTSPEGTYELGSGDAGSTNDGSVLSLITLPQGALVSLGGAVMEARVSLDVLTGAVVNIGFSDVLAESNEHSPHKIVATTISDAGLTVTNTACFVWGTEATSTDKWHHVTEKAGTIAPISVSANGPVVDTYATLRIEIDSDGTTRFYVDGTLDKTIETAVATTSLLIPFIGIDGEDGTPVVTDLAIDYILFEGNRPSSNA